MFSGEKVNNFCGGEIAARLAASGNLLKPGISFKTLAISDAATYRC
jgi:hypothetical protein